MGVAVIGYQDTIQKTVGYNLRAKPNFNSLQHAGCLLPEHDTNWFPCIGLEGSLEGMTIGGVKRG